MPNIDEIRGSLSKLKDNFTLDEKIRTMNSLKGAVDNTTSSLYDDKLLWMKDMMVWHQAETITRIEIIKIKHC